MIVWRCARRIPGLVIRVCPKCGEKVERVRYLEVWRDPMAREVVVGPLAKIEDEGGALTIHLGSEWLKIPKNPPP